MTQAGWGRITDVPGVLVGHDQRIGDGWLSGVTVVVPPPGSVGAVDVRGGGPGTHETDALDPTTMVATVDAVALTGGSAFGLAAAGGVQRWCVEHDRGWPVGPPEDRTSMRVPIVPAAAVFDLGRGGDPGATPDAEMGYQAAASARSGEVTTGVVGAGTGTTLARATLKGGVGTASIHLPGGLVVGALAVANAFGSPFDAVTGDLLGRAFIPAGITRPDDDPAFAGRLAALWQRLSPANVRNPAASGPVQPPTPPANTTLAVVATNAALDPARARRTSTAAHDGLARAFCPVHTLLDGDAVFTLATGEIPVELPELVALQAAAADAVLLAILDALLTTGG